MDNNKDNKKKFVVIIGALAILLLLVGATYAYFSLNITSGNSKTQVNATTTPVDNISLKKSDGDLHITLRPDDMALSTLGDYYAVTEEDKNYDKNENMVSLAELTASGGTNNTAYNCEVKVTISKNNDDSMTSVLQAKDAEVRLSFGDLLEDVDLVGLKDANIVKTGHITLINNSNDFINAYLKVSNTEAEQEYLANKTLDINIDTEVIKCDVIGTSKIELALRNTNTSNTLSKELKGGMFRYQGSAEQVTDNYICFGTDDKQTCLEHQDQYMYRIIGVTPEGKLKVIKKEALEDKYQWCTVSDTDIEFPNSNVYDAINGTSFLKNNDYVPQGWEIKIANSLWTYGDIYGNDERGAAQISKELYLVETGRKGTRWNVKTFNGDEGALSYVVNTESPHKGETMYYIRHENKKWSKVFSGKVSLMYLSDYSYSVNDTANCQADARQYAECKTGWMHLSQNDPDLIGSGYELSMTRRGFDYWNGKYSAYYVTPNGSFEGAWAIAAYFSARPVFFLNNDIEISGKGTMEEPYMIAL